MSEKSQGADGATQQADGNVVDQLTSESKSNQTVKFETYDKVMSKLKKTETEQKALLEKLSQIEQEKLEATGQKEQLIDKLKKDLDAEKKRVKDVTKTYATNVIHSQFKTKAIQEGCVNPNDLVQLMDFSDIDVDESFTVNEQIIAEKVETMKKNKPYLFASKNLNVKDVSRPGFESGKIDFAKMSREDLLKYTKGNPKI